ncbi:carbohydrate ABC transporter permease [Ruania halotolerans]|uniref:carbohydrate ABC transporter permease n=1 Tax=Ruania halotolerans TaxID=2897773 RepID=UPI001E520470|nr:carbohydrate ABC transporter permease [Ruania halotolerans]UFU06072.1 carbohydrate ABC transporter permease [Ruania halotolerans]
MTTTSDRPQTDELAEQAVPAPDRAPRRRPSRRRDADLPDRGLLSSSDRKRLSVRWTMTPLQWVMFVVVTALSVLPLLWLAKSAISPTQEILREPFRLWPSEVQWSNFSEAWTTMSVGRYMWNTLVLTGGSVVVQVFVAATLSFGIAVLRPAYGKVVYALVLATLLLPPTVSLIALYLTILDLPLLGLNLQNTVWAIWLPAGVHGFSVLLCVRFFQGIPRELFEAAQIDGAGPWTIFQRIVLPMSRPILAVISLLAVMNSWKDFLWPLIAVPDTDRRPITVALSIVARSVEENLLFAGLLIATLPPVLLFIIFQRQIVRGAGFTGLKG